MLFSVSFHHVRSHRGSDEVVYACALLVKLRIGLIMILLASSIAKLLDLEQVPPGQKSRRRQSIHRTKILGPSLRIRKSTASGTSSASIVIIEVLGGTGSRPDCLVSQVF